MLVRLEPYITAFPFLLLNCLSGRRYWTATPIVLTHVGSNPTLSSLKILNL